jgi:monoamine oxidase
MLFMVSEELYDAGFISVADRDWAQGAAVLMLDYVPGTDNQKLQAMGQRFDKLMRTRSIEALMEEYNETSAWCQKNFL